MLQIISTNGSDGSSSRPGAHGANQYLGLRLDIVDDELSGRITNGGVEHPADGLHSDVGVPVPRRGTGLEVRQRGPWRGVSESVRTVR